MKEFILALLCALIASSGFWALMSKKMDKKSNEIKLLIGLGHDRIMYLGIKYIQRGWITKDEYENLSEYLYTPYRDAGGNGSAKKVMQEVDKLPIKEDSFDLER